MKPLIPECFKEIKVIKVKDCGKFYCPQLQKNGIRLNFPIIEDTVNDVANIHP